MKLRRLGHPRRNSGSHPDVRKISRTDAALFVKSDPVNLVFGTFVLAIGWLHFNTSGCLGVSLGREELVGRIAVVTMVGASFGTVAGMLFSHMYYDGVIRVQEASTGTLSGLVAITAACGCIDVWQAAISAFVAGLLSCEHMRFSHEGSIDSLVCDSPCDASSIGRASGRGGCHSSGRDGSLASRCGGRVRKNRR